MAGLDRCLGWAESRGRPDVAVGVALVGVLSLGLASRWPVQAVTGYRLEDLGRAGPALLLLGVGLLAVSAGVAATGGRSAAALGVPVRRRVLVPAGRAARVLGLGPLPQPRVRTLLVHPWLLAACCALLTQLAVLLLPAPGLAAARAVLDSRYAAAAAAGPLGTIGFCLLGAGLVEELLFRGPVVLAARLGADRRVLVPLVALSGVLFALFHLSRGPLNVLSTGLWGLLLAGYAARRRSLWPVVLAHGLYDVYAFGTAGYLW